MRITCSMISERRKKARVCERGREIERVMKNKGYKENEERFIFEWRELKYSFMLSFKPFVYYILSSHQSVKLFVCSDTHVLTQIVVTALNISVQHHGPFGNTLMIIHILCTAIILRLNTLHQLKIDWGKLDAVYTELLFGVLYFNNNNNMWTWRFYYMKWNELLSYGETEMIIVSQFSNEHNSAKHLNINE